jgi:hypothetical protein
MNLNDGILLNMVFIKLAIMHGAYSQLLLVQAVDIYVEIGKKRNQSTLLAQYKMLLCKEDVSLLVQCNLMDELIQVVEDVDRAKMILNNEK